MTDVVSLERRQDFTADFGFPFLIDTTDVAGDDERTRTRFSVGQEWIAGRFGTDYLRWRAFWQDSVTRQDTFESRETFIAGRPGRAERQRDFRFEQQLAGLEVNAMSVFETGSAEHELAYGLEFEIAETTQIRDGTERDLVTGVESKQVGPDLFPLRDFPESQTESVGLYVQDRIRVGPVTLVPGLRWDRYELDPQPDAIFLDDNPGIETVGLTDDRISPKFGVVWQLSERWQVYGQYAEGFRAPPVNDVNVGFTNFQFGYTAIPNADLRSETSRGYELGLRFGGDTASLDVALFETRYDDFIESFQVVGFDPINQLLIFQSVNLSKVDIAGVELQGRFAPAFMPEGMSLQFSAAYAEGENRETGAPINSVPPLNGVVGLEYRQPGGRWSTSLVARSAAAQDDIDQSSGALLSPEGYVIVDALGSWRVSERLQLSAGIYNLADRDYTAYLDVEGVPANVETPDRFQRPVRNVSIAVGWRF